MPPPSDPAPFPPGRPDVAFADDAACPSESTILALWRGKLETPARRDVEGHLASCAACRELVSVLAPTSASPSQPAATVTDAPVSVGQIVADKYQVERVLGRGGMGWVVRARHLVLRTPVALKFLLPAAAERPEAVLRFIREARAAAMIDSEHVARVFDAGKLPTTGEPYLVLEYLDGIDLAQYLVQRGPLPIEEAISYVRQACSALALAHARGIIHRDIKPANLFLVRRGDGRSLLKVLDFGIAKVAHAVDGGLTDGDLTTGAAVMGSPRYMAPEQIHSSKRVDERADVWALGVVLFELLTGKLPFDGDTLMSLCAAIVTDPPANLRELRTDVPAELEAAVMACLDKDPARRTPTVHALAEAIAPFAAPDDYVSLRPASLPPGAPRTPIPPRTPSTPPMAATPAKPAELGAETGAAVAANTLPPPRVEGASP